MRTFHLCKRKRISINMHIEENALQLAGIIKFPLT